ncbi:MAG: hypothetical protein Q8P31_03625 [Bacillota bacterium]|nr:hypothetical protein [Bacillota bacterium]
MAWEWSRGTPCEQRAAAAGLCEPRLLSSPERVAGVRAVLDQATGSVPHSLNRHRDDFRALRKGLAYCWSVAVAACLGLGRPAFEKWLGTSDPDTRWILRQNLGKARLMRMDPAWVERCRHILDTPGERGGRG